MKTDIHPRYHQATVTCASCSNTFVAGSTIESIRVDICSNCHPFFTGQKKLIDTEGRVERFERRMSQRQETEQAKPAPAKPQVVRPVKATAATPKAPAPATDAPKSLRDMLQEAANA